MRSHAAPWISTLRLNLSALVHTVLRSPRPGISRGAFRLFRGKLNGSRWHRRWAGLLYAAPSRIDECFRIGSHADLSAIMTYGTSDALCTLVFNDPPELWLAIGHFIKYSPNSPSPSAVNDNWTSYTLTTLRRMRELLFSFCWKCEFCLERKTS